MAKLGYHHGNLREALIDAATHLIETDGPDGFSLAKASRAVGVTHAAAYKHFQNRIDLVQAVSDQAMRAFGDALQSAYNAHDEPRDQYVATGEAVVSFARSRPHLYGLAFGSRRQDDLATLADPPPDTVLQRFIEMIRAWQGAGWLRAGDPSEWALVLWAAAHGLALLVASGRLRVTEEEARTLARTLLLHIHAGIG